MTTPERSIELDVEVDGSPEAVWRAIATGPGISSWYVPHIVEEREGGAAITSFGQAPDRQIPGRVTAWDPPHRIAFEGGEDAGGLAFEWLVEARAGGTCIVRLVNSGFGHGGDWDDQYDAMVEGWCLFLGNLQLHCRHFAGQDAVSMLPMVTAPGPRAAVWTTLSARLGLAERPEPGDRVTVNGDDGALLSGTVERVGPQAVALLVDEPAPGTAFVAVERGGAGCIVSVWSYLYGDDAPAIVDRDGPRWQAWLRDVAAA